MEIASDRRKRPRFLMNVWVWMLILLLVVIFAAFKIIPLGPVEILSSRQAAKMMVEAQRWESQSLYITASELYSRISSNPKIKPQLRMQAALRLAALSRNHLIDSHATLAALEKAYRYSPAGPDHDALGKQLEELRGSPLVRNEPASPSADKPSTQATTPSSLAPAEPTLPLPKGARVIARVGGEEATLEEILYAWSQFNSNTAPTREMLKPFVNWYLDMVLLADEARQRGLDRQSRFALDLRVKRVLGLNQALTQQFIEGLKPPKLEVLKDYYKANEASFTQPGRVIIGHLMVNNVEAVRVVGKALSKGEKIERLAKTYGLDAKQLKDGFTIGPVGAAEVTIPRIGTAPGLTRKLMTYEDGTTTGPIKIQNAWHWIKIISKAPPKAEPFENVREDVLMSYQKQQLARIREQVLQDLHKRTPITIFDEKMKADLEAKPAEQAAAKPKPATTDQVASSTERVATPPAAVLQVVTAKPTATSTVSTETKAMTESKVTSGTSPDRLADSKDKDQEEE